MSAESSQSRVVAWLSDPATHEGAPVEVITTHAALVFLAGERALKMKRAVTFAYLDFSTLPLRREMLERELTLNRRTAPDLYRRVIPIYGSPEGAFSFEPSPGAEPIEFLLEMKRFDTECVLDRVAQRGKLTEDLIDKLATRVARFHAEAERRAVPSGYEHFLRVLRSNEAELKASTRLDCTRTENLARRSYEAAYRHQVLLDDRAAAGFVRHCHGDLHLGNIVLLKGKPTPFDCIEFSDDFATIDTLYDLAFLLMDLIHRGERSLANRLLNGYLWAAPFVDLAATLDGLALLPLFISCRAAIRAHVLARRIDSSAPAVEDLTQLDSYLDGAERALTLPRPRLVAIGGLSGSGKTTLARAIAPDLASGYGAVHLRTDVIRKQKRGSELAKRLPDADYAKDASAEIYREMLSLAFHALQAGQAVIVDGVFADQNERTAAECVALAAGAPFDGLWLEAAPEEMMRRIQARRGDASDATSDVLRRQLDYDFGTLTWPRIDGSGDASAVEQRALERLYAKDS